MKNLRGFKQNNAGSSNNMPHSMEDLKQYENMSEDALFEKLMGEVSSAKSKGSFSAEELRNSVEKMKPLLQPAQVTKLEHLLKLITSN